MGYIFDTQHLSSRLAMDVGARHLSEHKIYFLERREALSSSGM
jgi:hypothetical protein